MSKSLILKTLLCGLALIYIGASQAATDPSPDQVYQELRSGRIAQAEQMVNQVLQDKPKSGQAHYVAAEVYARAGDISRARSELATAQQLEPGLPFARQASVAELQRELSSNRLQQAPVWTPVQHQSSSTLPWGAILLVLLGIGVVWLLVRRRVQGSSYGSYPGTIPPGPGQPGYGAPGMGGGPYYPGGGGGSGLMGSLGTGLAIGAGAAVGEELVHHVLDGNHSSGGIVSGANAGEYDGQPQNSDMGGQDFGLNDGNSWGDSSGGDGGSFDSGGGGDDWT